MKKYQRLFACLLIAAIGMTLMAGCSSDEPDTDGTTTQLTEEVSETTGQKAAPVSANVIQSSTAEYDDYVVRIVAGSGLCGAPLHMALEQGFFEEEGIQVEMVRVDGSTLHDLIATGNADCGYAMVPDTVLRIDQGFECKIALGIHTGCLEVIVRADSDITELEQLKGLKIGVPGLASSGRVFATRALQSAGVGVTADNMEVEFLAFTAGELAMVLEDGTVDAVAVNDPTAGNIIANGIGRSIFANATHPDYQDEICCVAVLSPEFVEEHPYAAAAFVRALQKGGKFVTENPEETARLQIENSHVPSGDVDLFVQLHQRFDYKTTVEGGREGLYNNMVDLQKAELISADLDIERVLEAVYVTFDDVPDSLMQ